jgi:hypothetical protein
VDPDYVWRKRNRSDGFFKVAVGGPKAVHTLDHVIKSLPNLTGGSGDTATATRYVPCYEDKSDPTTLRYVVIIPDSIADETLVALDADYPPMLTRDARGGGGGP